MEGVWSYLRRKPLQRRVTVAMTIAVAVAILLSNVAGYVALRTTLVQASQSIALTVADDLVPPAAASLEQSGQLSAEVRQAGGVIVEAVRPDGTVARVPGESAELVLEPGDLASAAADGPTGAPHGRRHRRAPVRRGLRPDRHQRLRPGRGPSAADHPRDPRDRAAHPALRDPGQHRRRRGRLRLRRAVQPPPRPPAHRGRRARDGHQGLPADRHPLRRRATSPPWRRPSTRCCARSAGCGSGSHVSSPTPVTSCARR